MKLTKANIARITFPAGKAEHIVYDDDLAGFGLRLHPSGRRTWFVQYRLGQKQRRLKLGTVEQLDPEKARTHAKAALAKVSLGSDPATETEEAKAKATVTLKRTAEDYLTRYAANRLKPGSLAEVERHLRQHWKPLGERPLSSIKRAHVAARLAEIARDNGPFAANRARAALSALFTWSIGEGFADDNPVAGTHRPTEEVARDRVLTDAEVALVWRQSGAGDYGAIVRLLLLTACRRDEVGAMAWSELQGSTWSVPGERTKNGLPLDLTLPPMALEVLQAVHAREGRDLVFGARAGPFSGWSQGEGRARRPHAGGAEGRARQQGDAGALAAARPPADRGDPHGRPRRAAARGRGGAEPHLGQQGWRGRDLQPRRVS